jgi:peptide/nickel transport system permease protein
VTPILRFLAQRLLSPITVLLVVVVMVFLLMRLTLDDPAAIIAGDSATTEQIQQVRESPGLSRPIVVQFGIWFGGVLHGDLGESFFYKKTVVQLIAQRLEPTLALALCTILLAVIVAVPLGAIAGWRHGGWLDRALMGFSTLGFRSRSSFSVIR